MECKRIPVIAIHVLFSEVNTSFWNILCDVQSVPSEMRKKKFRERTPSSSLAALACVHTPLTLSKNFY